MLKFISCTTVAIAVSLSAVSAHAGGWGGSKRGNHGLVNVDTGDINILNGILNGSPILSGNGLDLLDLGVGGGILNILNKRGGKRR